jgi:hypothetical protein
MGKSGAMIVGRIRDVRSENDQIRADRASAMFSVIFQGPPDARTICDIACVMRRFGAVSDSGVPL